MLEALAYRRLPQARVQVFDWPIWGMAPRGFRGGVVLTDETDAPLRHRRRERVVDSFRPDEAYDEVLPGQYVYAGPICDHFGHYMSECVHRLAAARMRGLRFPPLFVASHGVNPHPSHAAFPEFVKEILAFLDIRPAEVKVVNRNTVVESLHVVEPGAHLGGAPRPGYVEALAGFSAPKLDARHGGTRRPHKLYVSRSGLPPRGMLLGEAWFEEQLERDGFTIFRPEEWRFSPQLDHYRKAEAVVFLEGSACHGAELLGAGMIRRGFLLPRRRGHEAAMFARIVASRSQSFTLLDDCTEYLGSANISKANGVEHAHHGATWLRLDRIVAALRAHGLAELRGIHDADYHAAAAADLERYLAFQARVAGRFDEAHARKLSDAFARQARP